MASGVIKQPSVLRNSSSYPLKFGYIYSDATYAYIENGKLLFSSYRNPILCVYNTQQGGIRVFLMWSGRTAGDWTLTVTDILSSSGVTAALDGNNIKISGTGGNWGQGYAIGL